jgi:hypothetical protein
MTALKDFSYQLVTISLRLIAEVLGLGLMGYSRAVLRKRGLLATFDRVFGSNRTQNRVKKGV